MRNFLNGQKSFLADKNNEMKKSAGIKLKLYKAFVDGSEVPLPGWIYGNNLKEAKQDFEAKYPQHINYKLKQKH